jgi:hypothetical protein
MESTSFFEKKLNLTPNDFNELKKSSVEELLLKKAKETIEMKCSEHGFVLPGSIKLISRSVGYFESARFTGDAVYYVKLEGNVIYPADGVRVTGEVIRKNKMGLYIDYRKAIRIQVPRDLHIGNQEYENIEVGDMVDIELKRSKFQINDPYILASGLFIAKNNGINAENTSKIVVPTQSGGNEEDEEEEEEEEENGKNEDESDEDDDEDEDEDEDEEEEDEDAEEEEE